MEEGENDPPRRRKRPRGFYKGYFIDPDIRVPDSTIRSRNLDPNQPVPPAAVAPTEPPVDIAMDQEVGAVLSPAAIFDVHGADQDSDGQSDHNSDTQSEQSGHGDSQSDQDDEQSAGEDEINPADRIRKFVAKHGLNERLHPNFNCTRLEVLLMILHMAYRHCNTQHFIEDQIKFVNTIFGSPVLDVSYYIYQKLFQSSASVMHYYFCPKCEVLVGSKKDFPVNTKSVNCPKCNYEIDVSSFDSGNYFVIISVKQQIETVLNRPGVKLVERNEESEDICDVCDGEIYRQCSLPGGPLANKNALTVTFNTDGVAVYESTQNSLWPIQLYVNELCPQQRFQSENLILGGLWFGRSAPNMALFLKPFLEELNGLSDVGVDYYKPDGSLVKCPIYSLAVSVDAVAKCKIVCQKQFNGYFGCLYCLHPNDAVVEAEGTSRNRLIRHYDTSKTYPLRTEMEVIRDMYEADKRDRENKLGSGSVNGFLGISILLTIVVKYAKAFPSTLFSIVWGVVIDYLHGILEGVMSDLIEMFVAILSDEKLRIFNERLLKICPPQAMNRRPRSLFDRTHWKGKEYRSLLLYYILPCIQDLLPSANFTNLKLLCNASYILLCDKISPTALTEARTSLSQFVEGYQKLYGLSKVTYNLHLCTHLADLVQRLGPLWAYSNFIFESGNGHLVKLIKGTRSVVHEVTSKFCVLQAVSNVIAINLVRKDVIDFCSDIMSVHYSQKAVQFGDNICVTGSFSYVEVDDLDFVLLTANDVSVTEERKVKNFHRAIKEGIIYCSNLYSKGKVFNDSCVQLTDGTYAIIDKILSSIGNNLLCVIKPIRIAPTNLSVNIKKCCYDFLDNSRVVPFTEVARKCVFLTVADRSFVCDIPNLYERD